MTDWRSIIIVSALVAVLLYLLAIYMLDRASRNINDFIGKDFEPGVQKIRERGFEESVKNWNDRPEFTETCLECGREYTYRSSDNKMSGNQNCGYTGCEDARASKNPNIFGISPELSAGIVRMSNSDDYHIEMMGKIDKILELSVEKEMSEIKRAEKQIADLGLTICAGCLSMTKHCHSKCGCLLCVNYRSDGVTFKEKES